MTIEDDDAARPGPSAAPRMLDRMGIDELQNYIAGLRTEIGRAEAEIGRKQAIRAAADSVFKGS